MRVKSIEPIYIIRKAFILNKSIYFQLLLFCIPVVFLIFLGIDKSNLLLLSGSFLVAIYFMPASILYIFRSINGNSGRLNNFLIESSRIFAKLLLWSILLACILIPFFLLFIVPGIYLSCRLIFSFFLIVKEDYPIIESLKYSWKITRNNFRLLFLNGFIIFCFYLFAFLGVIKAESFGQELIIYLLMLLVTPLFLTSGVLIFNHLVELDVVPDSEDDILKQLDSENTVIEFRGFLTEKDYWQFMWETQLRELVLIVIIILSIPIIIQLFAATNSPEGFTSEKITSAISSLVFTLLIISSLFLVFREIARKNFKSIRMFQSGVSGYVKAKGVRLATDYTKTDYSWEAFIGYREYNNLMLLYVGGLQALLLPRRFFSSEVDWNNFYLIVSSKIPKK